MHVYCLGLRSVVRSPDVLTTPPIAQAPKPVSATQKLAPPRTRFLNIEFSSRQCPGEDETWPPPQQSCRVPDSSHTDHGVRVRRQTRNRSPRRLLKKSPLREIAYYILWCMRCMKQTTLSIVSRFREIGVFQSSPRDPSGCSATPHLQRPSTPTHRIRFIRIPSRPFPNSHLSACSSPDLW